MREDLTPAVLMDVENFFAKYRQSFLIGHCLPISPRSLGLSAKEMLLKPGPFLNRRKAWRVAMIEALG